MLGPLEEADKGGGIRAGKVSEEGVELEEEGEGEGGGGLREGGREGGRKGGRGTIMVKIPSSGIKQSQASLILPPPYLTPPPPSLPPFPPSLPPSIPDPTSPLLAAVSSRNACGTR
jgi:hypothetical protein